MVEPQQRGLRVPLDVVARRVAILYARDAHAALRADDVLHEVGHVAHHRTPAGLVPADGAVSEGHLQLAVVVHAGLELLREPRADGADADGPRLRHQAHDVDVVHAAVDDR